MFGMKMNLWDIHKHPNQLKRYNERLIIPNVAWSALVSGLLSDEEIVLAKEGISLSPRLSFNYAWKLLKYNRFPEGETSISKSPEYSYRYALEILKGRFQMGEIAIATDGFYSYKYAKHILKERFAIGEEAISRNSLYTYRYAKDVIKGRFELGEPAIYRSINPKANYRKFINSINENSK